MTTYKEYLDKGIEELRTGDLDIALDNMNKSIELRNDWDISYFYRAVVNQALKNFDDALLDYTKALQINPKMTDAYYNRAEILLSRKDIESPDIERAVADLEKAIELDDKFVSALFAMGAAQKKLGNYNKSLEYLDRVLAIEPDAIMAKALKKLILQKYV